MYQTWTSVNRSKLTKRGYKFVDGQWYRIEQVGGQPAKEKAISESQVPGAVLDDYLGRLDLAQARQVANVVMARA